MKTSPPSLCECVCVHVYVLGVDCVGDRSIALGGGGESRNQATKLISKAVGPAPHPRPRSEFSCVMTTKSELRLTRDGFHPFAHDDLIPSGPGAQGLVAHADEDDGEEAEDEAGSGPNVPRLEDDAQVRRVPSKQHLDGATRERSAPTWPRRWDGWMDGEARDRASTYVHAAHGGHIVALVAAMAGHGHVHVAVAVRHISLCGCLWSAGVENRGCAHLGQTAAGRGMAQVERNGPWLRAV